MTEVFKKTCPFCGKEIISLHEKQLEQNYGVHILSCKKKEENNENPE